MNYDDIADSYDKKINDRSDRSAILIPTAAYYLGDLTGLGVLDFGCGSGFYTRLIQKWGASEVVGVDLSAEMIKLAEAQEQGKPCPIQYRTGDIELLGTIGQFDVVFAAFVLHYAPTVFDLARTVKGIRANLKPKGRFVSFNVNPFCPTYEGRKYDVEVRANDAPLKDGSAIQRMVYAQDEKILTLDQFHYEPTTYEHVFRSAGFSKISWNTFMKGREADRGVPPGYWDEYLSRQFGISVLVAE